MDRTYMTFLHVGMTIFLSATIFYALAIFMKTDSPVTDFVLTTICVHLIYRSCVSGYTSVRTIK